MEKIQSIQGAQCTIPGCGNLQSNSNSTQVIKACKVYDWTVEFDSTTVNVPVGDVANCGFPGTQGPCGFDPLIDPNVELSVEVPGAEGFNFLCTHVDDPCIVDADTKITCQAVQVRRNANLGFAGGAIVTVAVAVPITVVIKDCKNGTVLCRCTATARFYKSTVLCVPEPFDRRNVACKVFSVDAEVAPIVQLDSQNNYSASVAVSICLDIQVEAQVKLEVCGRFAYPRKPIAVPSVSACNVAFKFPTGCSIYPTPNTCNQSICIAPFITQMNVYNAVNGIVINPIPIGTAQVCINQFTICNGCNAQDTIVTGTVSGPMNLTFNFNGFTDSVSTPVASTYTFNTVCGGGGVPDAVAVIVGSATSTSANEANTFLVSLNGNFEIRTPNFVLCTQQLIPSTSIVLGGCVSQYGCG